MKRSEMLDKLRDELADTFELDHVTLSVSRRILDFIEKEGMTPPPNKEWFKIDLIKQDVVPFTKHEWEEE